MEGLHQMWILGFLQQIKAYVQFGIVRLLIISEIKSCWKVRIF